MTDTNTFKQTDNTAKSVASTASSAIASNESFDLHKQEFLSKKNFGGKGSHTFESSSLDIHESKSSVDASRDKHVAREATSEEVAAARKNGTLGNGHLLKGQGEGMHKGLHKDLPESAMARPATADEVAAAEKNGTIGKALPMDGPSDGRPMSAMARPATADEVAAAEKNGMIGKGLPLDDVSMPESRAVRAFKTPSGDVQSWQSAPAQKTAVLQ